MSGSRQSTVCNRAEGLALIAVLVALAVLLTMTGPFLISMGHGDAAARAVLDERQADWGAASARDLVLQSAANGAFAIDPTPVADGLDEYPQALEIPAAFAALERTAGGRNVLQAEVEDLSRRIDLNSATPLVLANLLGLVARVREEADSAASEIVCDGDLSAFPDSGFLICNREVIRYGGRDGNRFFSLQRGVFAELGFFPSRAFPDYTIAEQSLVLDLRTVLAVTWPFRGDGVPGQFRPYGSVAEVSRMEEGGFPGFSARELEILERHTTVTALQDRSARWGKGERIFEFRLDELEQPRILLVKSDAALGAGRIVRIRSLDGRLVEHGLVWDTVQRGNRGEYTLPRKDWVALLQPLVLPFEPLETVIEPLVQVPVNLNTADREVLVALLANLRRRSAGTVRDAEHRSGNDPVVFGAREAAMLADRILMLRGGTGAEVEFPVDDPELAPQPFDGWEDVATRLVPLMTGTSGSLASRELVLGIYDALQIGCPGSMEQGTMPIAFQSSPLVRYRASASHRRLTGLEVARQERTGTAIALPGQRLFFGAATQEALEDAFRLDRHTPWWQTGPINTSAVAAHDVDTAPPLRTGAHLFAELFPDMGFGEARFPDRSGTEGTARPQPAVTPLGYPQPSYAHESFLRSRHPEGRDLAAEGPYLARNSMASGETASNDHGRISFPMTNEAQVVSRHAVSFWFRLEDGSPQVLYDLTAPLEDPDRNRISCRIGDDGRLVFELLDEAGLDPDPAASDYAPERSAAIWEVPVEDLELVAGTWYHASISALGNRPGQLSMLVDGVPRGEPRMRTFTTAPIEVYTEDRGVATALDDRGRYIPIRVESTEHFPERGVLRIGLELFEYSSKDDTTFYCVFDDSAGGRRARASMHEFTINVPRDENGDPREDLLKIVNGDLEAVAPDHPTASTVELYGYSIPVYPQRVLQPGGARLTGSIGPFAVARPINQSSLRQITLDIGQGRSIALGEGFDETWTGDIELGNPVPNPPGSGPSYRPDAADEAIATTFATGGGYALLVQFRMRAELRAINPGTISLPAEVGGVEVIRYAARQGTRLTGVQRAVTLPVPLTADAETFFDPARPRNFVVRWSEQMTLIDPNTNERVSLNDLPLYMLTVTPISIPVQGEVDTDTTLVNWAQIREEGGDDAETEWVRYNAFLDRQHLVRAEQAAFNLLRFRLTQQTRLEVIGVSELGGLDPAEIRVLRDPWLAPVDDGRRRIGYVDPIEVRYPIIHEARAALRFRGDPMTGTSSHAHPGNAQVLPVHRFEFDWPGYGLGTPRAGRGDRVALVQGSRRQVQEIPVVQWLTVNWCARHYDWDHVEVESSGDRARDDARELKGDWPFQLIAFQAPVAAVFLGEAESSRHEENLHDSRFLDRIVKFPSGELPAAAVEEAWFGAPVHDDGQPSRGLIDEIAYTARRSLARPLDQQLDEEDLSFFVRPNVALSAVGPLVDRRPREWERWPEQGRFPDDGRFPEQGGLLAIDGEILAFESYDPGSGEVRLAAGGRGLLGTQARVHDEGAIVQVLEHVPAAILTTGVSEQDATIPVLSVNGLPEGSGTVLIGTELLHYTWMRGGTELGMPQWRDPDDAGRATHGLFRGRYGTTPTSLPSGAAAIWFPIRYWDRYHERADDPELAYCQTSISEGPVFFDSFGWRADGEEPLVELECLVRIDERAPFDADPERTDGLWLFREGEPDGAPNPIRRYGERFEARFMHVYRPGAFDPVTFRQLAWKRAPTLRWFLLTYEGETRILAERITAR